MPAYVEVTTSSQSLLPSPCPECLWWQTLDGLEPASDTAEPAYVGPGGPERAPERTRDHPEPPSGESALAGRLGWMRDIEESWGSVGLVTVEGREVLASIQFAPVTALPRTHILSPGAMPDESVLLFCLRGRVGRPSVEAEELLHRAMMHLRRKHVRHAYAYARPLGSKGLCGMRNLFGLEFLEANGFTVVRAVGSAYLVQTDLAGLAPAVTEAGWTVRRLLGANGHPSPATFHRS